MTTVYRYKLEIPAIDYNPDDGFVDVYCSPDLLDWESLNWERWGSGGDFDARHMFVDDWRLEHLWRRQGQGLAKVICQGVVTAPDFSIDLACPLPLAAFQVWRSRVLAKYWQENDAIVVPALQWGSPRTFPICAKGILPGSVVAVRGPQKGTEDDWLVGMDYMIQAIQPEFILHFGRKIQYSRKARYFTLRTTKFRRKKA